MKRPLFFVAVLCCLGIFLLNLMPGARALLLYDRPSFAVDLSYSASGFRAGEAEGDVLWIMKKNGHQVIILDGGEKFGKLYCYLDSDELMEPSYIGARVRMEGSFFLFKESENPGEFDSRAYYENLGVYLGLAVTDMALLKSPGFALKRPFYAVYSEAMEILSAFSDTADLAFYETLLTTYSGEEEEATDLLSDFFLTQLFSAGGLLFAALGMLIYRISKRVFKSGFLKAFVPVFLMCCYGAVIGNPLTFLRGLCIFSLRLFAPCFRRSFDFLTASGLFLLLFILNRPTLVLLPAVTYYFAVIVSVGILYPLIKRVFRLRNGIFLYAAMLLSLQCAFLPLSLLNSYGINLYQPLLSAILMPLKGLALIAMLLGLILGLFMRWSGVLPFFFGAAHYLRLFTEQISEGASVLPGAMILTGRPAVLRTAVYAFLYAGLPVILNIFLSLRKRKEESKEVLLRKKHRFYVLGYLAALYIFGILFLRADPFSEEEIRYVQLSVGQGDSEIFLGKDFCMVVDNGSSSLENAGEILINALKYYGRNKVDVLVLTHADDDHVNGVAELVENRTIKVLEIWISGSPEEAQKYAERFQSLKSESLLRRVFFGDRFEKAGVTLTVLSPNRGDHYFGNDASVVFMAEKGAFSFLFTGDISEDVERGLTLPKTSFTALKVAHHGSRFSTSESFLRGIDAGFAFISAGKGNSYGHPHKETLVRLKNDGMKAYSTSDYGAIELRVRKKSEKLRFFRRNRVRND